MPKPSAPKYINRNLSSKNNRPKIVSSILGVIVIGLVLLILWFVYLLVKPQPKNDDTNKNTTNTVNNINTTNSNKNKNNNSETKNNSNSDNKNDNENDNTNNSENDNDNENTNSDEEDEDGLVEPDNDEPGEAITLYFPKSTSDCGTVYAVERKIELGEDPYGQTILADMAGPEEDETGYVDGIPSSIRLRQVEYAGSGPKITVSEDYNNLDSCTKQTVDAQLIKTANAMFDLPENTSGEVVVGIVETEDTEDTEE